MSSHPLALPYTVLEVSGEEALSFLQGQLTNSLTKLESLRPNQPTAHQRNGYCSAKGRLLANFRAWKTPAQTVRLLMPQDLAQGVLKRLKMFVLRAKVQIDALEGQVYGLVGLPPLETPALMTFQLSPQLTLLSDPYSEVSGSQRAWLFHEGSADLQPSSLPGLLPALGEAWPSSGQALAPYFCDPSDWHWRQTRSAEPWIQASTQDQFVPQTLNFELLQGVDFQKGCYPGQEVVARSQYLGKLKKRLFVVSAAPGLLDLPLGSDIWLRRTPGLPATGAVSGVAGEAVESLPPEESPVGELVQSAVGESTLALVSIDLAAWRACLEAAGQLVVGTSQQNGLILQPLPQPYSVPLEISQPVRPKLG